MDDVRDDVTPSGTDAPTDGGNGPADDPTTNPAGTDPGTDTGTASGDDERDPEGADQLGDPGKKALDAMKAKWKAERDKRRELEAKLAERDAPANTDQPDADSIRREAMRAANARIIRSEIKAAAAGKLADPADALAYLDADQFEVDDNGEVDADEINDAIEELLSRKPYLAAPAKGRRFQGSGDGGAARKASGPSQLTRDDLERMSPAEIVKARREGRLRDLGVK